MPIARTPAEEEQNLRDIIESRRFPGIVGAFSDRGVAAEDERIYREHNVTHKHAKGGVIAEPNSPSMQCQCGNCGSHRRRASVTKTADKGKDVN